MTGCGSKGSPYNGYFDVSAVSEVRLSALLRVSEFTSVNVASGRAGSARKRAPQKCALRRFLYILVIRTFTERADTRVKEDKGDWDWIEVTCLFGEYLFRQRQVKFYAEQSVNTDYSSVAAASVAASVVASTAAAASAALRASLSLGPRCS